MTRSAASASVGAVSGGGQIQQRVADIVARASFIDERRDAGTYVTSPDQANDLDSPLLLRLRDAVAGGHDEGFRRWLDWSGLDLSGAVDAMKPVRLRNPDMLPPWGWTINEIIQAVSAAEDAGESGPVPFDDLLRPIVALAGRKLDDRVRAASHGDGVDPLSSFLGPAARETIDRSLLNRLSYVAAPTLAGELAARRPLGTAMLVTLIGAGDRSSEWPQWQDLYGQFVREARKEGLLPLFEGYPVLARLLAVTVDDWVDATMEFLSRLREDLNDLHEIFGPLRPADGPAPEFGNRVLLAGLHPELSDRHHGGRSTVAVTFASGLRLVYKPRDVSLEAAYSRLLDWCNSQDLPLRFSVLRVLDRGTHGWVEFVTHRECSSTAAVVRYYRRAGMQLALLYATGATDCHAENVIASGDQLALVDCETLLYGQPSPIDAVSDTTSFDSVLRVGLLPSWECRFDTQFTVDVSGLGFVESQPLPTRRWSRVNTDLMQLVTEAAPTVRLNNLPRYVGAVQRPVDHITALVDGFRTMYGLLLRNRESLAAPDGPFAALADGRMRLVFRPTAVYGALLEELLRPDHLRSGTDASLALWKLSRPFVEPVSCPPAWPVLAGELRALKRLDIPFFAASATETSVTTGLPEPLEGYFPRAPFEETLSRLHRLNPADLESQVEIIRGAVYCGVADLHSGGSPVAIASHPGRAQPPRIPNIGPDGFVEAAGHLARDIADRMIQRTGGDASWLGLNYAPRTGRMQIEFVGESVFDGTAGIAMFLAAYGTIAGDSRFDELAVTVLEPVRRTLEDPTSTSATSLARRLGIGGATGIGSIAYALSVVARLVDDPSLLSDAGGCIALVRELVDGAGVRDEHIDIDVVNGAAGACLSMLALHRVTQMHGALELAMTLGERVSDLYASTWGGDLSTANPGFAHGSAGVNYALVRLHQATGGVSPNDVSVDMLQRLAAADNAAVAGIEPGLMGSWCNGVPGIALALLGAHRTMQDPMFADLAVMVRDVETWPPGGVDHLCCGAFGRVEVLLTASEVLGHSQFQTAAISGAAALVDRARRGGGYQLQGGGFGAPYFDPSFFHGAAGIGYELLRLAAPERLPSVLLWD